MDEGVAPLLPPAKALARPCKKSLEAPRAPTTAPQPQLLAAAEAVGAAASQASGSGAIIAEPPEGMPLADLLRRQLLEAPNLADEIEALRKERSDKRKEVQAASRKLRQAIPMHAWMKRCA